MNKKVSYFSFLVVLVLMFTTVHAQVDPGTANLTHSWTFDDGTANDIVGDAEGVLMGTAIVADGSLITANPGDYMEMPGDIIAINLYDEITVEAWIVPIAGANTGYTMLTYFGRTVGGLGVDGYFITPARGDDKSRAAISCGNESTPWSAESGADGPELDDGELHHMVSTLSLTDITLYIDGQLTGSTPLAENNLSSLLSTELALISKGGYDADPTWLGEVLECNMYNRALTADEILFLYQRGGTPTDVDETVLQVPETFALLQNFPNPFNPQTNITYSLPEQSFVTLKVYDMLGREIQTLVNETRSAGTYTINFNAANLSSGLYLYRMEAGNNVLTKNMLLIK